MHTESTRKHLDSTLAAMEDRLDAYGELARIFGPLMQEQAALTETFATDSSPLPQVDASRLADGVPVLTDADCTAWAAPLAASAKRQLPLLRKILHLDDKTGNAVQTYLNDPVHLSALAQARIKGDWKHFENTSTQFDDLPSRNLLYISENVFAPAFRAMVGRLGKPLSEAEWEHGRCPACGSAPTIAYLSAKEPTDLDLVGGGGKKHLHCSLCGHDWRVKRNVCPSCGNDKDETREIFTVDGRPQERIEACHSCKSYILCIDLRECLDVPDLDAVQMGLIHLDIHAKSKGFSPMAHTLWNTLDS
ncbi:formate dehydrogenase accessory protein FdhE [Pseudodesulfovibrio sp.]|uniref:formate dehydrogenase accessory protein FdhE n=1 Tax=unclassified Pseudodesulfovibrio TaxID=2661612 RepID=UPI003AFF9E0E